MTINPDTVCFYADSVRYLYNLDFKYIICSLNYACKWDDNDMLELKKQYENLSGFYYDMTMAEE